MAQRRLTEAQLWTKLAARGYDDEAIAAAIASCKADGYVDDRLFASFYVESARKPVGDARLCAELVKRGIDREAAQAAISGTAHDERERLAAAYTALRGRAPELSYASIARRLERRGFRTGEIYRFLRARAQDDLGPLLGDGHDAEDEPRTQLGIR